MTRCVTGPEVCSKPQPGAVNVRDEREYIRLGDCPVGLFVFGGELYVKTSSITPSSVRVIQVSTGNAEWYHPDILVIPLEIDVKELFAGESEPEVKVAYLCDKKSCARCDNPDCHHTLDIEHAKNFERLDDGRCMEKADGCKLIPVTKDADLVRLGDYDAGVFEFADCLHVRAQAAHVGNDGIVCVEVLTGVCHVYQPDILIQPMELWEVDGDTGE